MASIPAVRALERRFAARGLRAFAVTRARDVRRVEEAMRKYQMPYPCLIDPLGAWQQHIGVRAVPAFVLLDRHGRRRLQVQGRLSIDSPAHKRLAVLIEAELER